MANLPQVIFGLALLVVGLASYRRSYHLSLLGEQLDAIGSRTPVSEVEPADWKVFLTKVVGGGVALFGALTLAIGLLAPGPGV